MAGILYSCFKKINWYLVVFPVQIWKNISVYVTGIRILIYLMKSNFNGCPFAFSLGGGRSVNLQAIDV